MLTRPEASLTGPGLAILLVCFSFALPLISDEAHAAGDPKPPRPSRAELSFALRTYASLAEGKAVVSVRALVQSYGPKRAGRNLAATFLDQPSDWEVALEQVRAVADPRRVWLLTEGRIRKHLKDEKIRPGAHFATFTFGGQMLCAPVDGTRVGLCESFSWPPLTSGNAP